MARVIFGDHYRVTTSRQFFVVLHVKLTLAAVRLIGCNRNNTLVVLEKGSLESVRYLRTLLGVGFSIVATGCNNNRPSIAVFKGNDRPFSRLHWHKS